ncbi:hypothetical protein BH11MYX1_BH11MYX1_05190 [soil metagenome]
MGRRLAVHAGSQRQALTALGVLLALATPALVGAAPRRRAAKVQFARGVAAYRGDDYAAASSAFGKSYAVEADVETLFAWAQAERKLGHCDKASDLYGKLLVSKLPAANKTVVKGQLEECKRIIADDLAASKAAADKATAERAEADRARQAEADRAAKADADHEARVAAERAAQADAHRSIDEPPRSAPAPSHGSAWYKDGLGDTLVVLGISGAGLGVAMLMSSHAAERDSKNPSLTYDQFIKLDDRATSRGTLGVISASVGGAAIVLGLVRYATRSTGDETPNVTGWLAPTGGGLAVARRF